MKILLVKLSAMGDVIHALPTVSDAVQQGAMVHWLVDERFAAIPGWHDGVERVITVPLQRWKKNPWLALGEVKNFLHRLRQEHYDQVVDLQGLVKSGILASLARGACLGPHADWAREKWATFFYQQTVTVNPEDHVVLRLRKVMAAALHAPVSQTPADFGLHIGKLSSPLTPSLTSVVNDLGDGFLILLHGAAWSSKLWPQSHWQQLITLLAHWPYPMVLPWGNAAEKQRAVMLAEESGGKARLLPPLSLAEMATLIARARGVVGLDSGFAHLAAALGVPVVTLFGATNPDYSGIVGEHQRFIRSTMSCSPCMQRQCGKVSSLPSPCFTAISPTQVADELARLLAIP